MYSLLQIVAGKRAARLELGLASATAPAMPHHIASHRITSHHITHQTPGRGPSPRKARSSVQRPLCVRHAHAWLLRSRNLPLQFQHCTQHISISMRHTQLCTVRAGSSAGGYSTMVLGTAASPPSTYSGLGLSLCTCQHITSHHITSHHITSHHITSHHTRMRLVRLPSSPYRSTQCRPAASMHWKSPIRLFSLQLPASMSM